MRPGPLRAGIYEGWGVRAGDMDTELTLSETFLKMGISLGVGLLVGMQRERAESRVAGIRTFPLITMLGTVLGLLALRFGGWVIAAGLLSVVALIIVGNMGRVQNGPEAPGVTTEAAMLLMYGVGAYLVPGQELVAVVVAGTVAVLLYLKPQMHAFVRKMGDTDFKAIMQFVLITLVILPVLPNQGNGPYNVLNPYKIWLMVVLIVGIRLAGYVAYKFLGARTGSLLSGVLGGLISSTATTVSYARQAREAPESISMAVLVIMMASTVVFVRVLVIIGIVAAPLFLVLVGPLGAMLGAMVLISGAVWLLTRKEQVTVPEQENPSELKPALIFAAVFALVQVGVSLAKDYFGTEGLYAVAFMSGLADMDAITLSTLQMAKEKQLDAGMAWRMILVASMANLVFKGASVAVLGNRRLFVRIGIPFGIALIAGCLILWFWPVQ